MSYYANLIESLRAIESERELTPAEETRMLAAMRCEAEDTAPVLWHRLTEVNEWEGETWYHYFLHDEENKVLGALEAAIIKPSPFTELKTVALTMDQAEVLTNRDDHNYMQAHWFAELTDFKGFAAATDKDLYKGGVRKFGKEVFAYEEGEDLQP